VENTFQRMFFSDLANDNQLKTLSNIGAQHALGQGSATCDSLAPLNWLCLDAKKREIYIRI